VVLQVSVESDPVNAPVVKLPFSVVVAVSPPESPEFVPQANPRTVAFSPPVAVMFPLRVAAVAVTEDADWVVTVGAQGEVRTPPPRVKIVPKLVPAEFVAYAR